MKDAKGDGEGCRGATRYVKEQGERSSKVRQGKGDAVGHVLARGKTRYLP